MLIIRLATENDIPAIMGFAEILHGKLNSLPMDKDVITHKIQRSCSSMQKNIISLHNELYFFVMEDVSKKQVVGCAAIDASVGLKPFYAYRISQFEHISTGLDFRRTVKLLELNTDLDGATELGSLYLLPEYRKKNNAKLLSYSRLLFLTIFPERCSDRVFADIRGYCEANEEPPFWKHVIKSFMPFEFAEADKLTGLEQRQFIIDLMPKSPIYIHLLHPDAQAAIRRAHPTAEPAKKMLEAQGFHSHEYVNIFDAGPTVTTFTNNIRIMNEKKMVKVAAIKALPHTSLPQHLFAAVTKNFRVGLAETFINADQVIISPTLAENLNVDVGDSLCVFTL